MRLPLWLVTIACAVGCGDDDLPTAAELHGSWTSSLDGTNRDWVFSATDDGTHPELAGLTDVYILSNYPTGTPPAVTQTGEYRVEVAQLSSGGEDDALVTVVHTGPGAPGTYGNRILGFTGDTFTIESTAGAAIVLTRASE